MVSQKGKLTWEKTRLKHCGNAKNYYNAGKVLRLRFLITVNVFYKAYFSQVNTDDPEIIGSGNKTEVSDNYDQYDDYDVVYAPGIYGEDTSDVNMAHLDQAYAILASSQSIKHYSMGRQWLSCKQLLEIMIGIQSLNSLSQ